MPAQTIDLLETEVLSIAINVESEDRCVYKMNPDSINLGQIGNRRYTFARSPFYRMQDNVNTYNLMRGTDAQLEKGLINKGLFSPAEEKKARFCVEEAITNDHLEITAYYSTSGS